MNEFRFGCVPGCTSCCRQKGFVYLTEEDLKRAAEFVRMSPAAFEKAYLYRTRYTLRLRKPRGSQCPFIREDGCSIHSAKPAQCRTFPFWPELVGSRKEWSQAARYCPGIGSGPLVTIEAAHRIATEMRESYPAMYE